MRSKIVIAICFISNLHLCHSQPRQSTLCSRAMVVTAHPEASKVGIEILKKGGNAIDASIAVQLALAVVYPNAGNIAGGGFMIVRTKNGKTDALDFRETAPAKASKDMYLDSAGNVIEGLSFFGGKAVGVPGTVDGLFKAHARYGKLPFNILIEPAIKLAEEGFGITLIQAKEFMEIKSDLDKYNPNNNYLSKDSNWSPAELLVQEDLAKTLKLIKDKGRDGFYKGYVAEQIVKCTQNSGGVMTLEDLAAYEAKWRTPVECKFRNLKIISMPPPSSGGVALCQLFTMLEQFNFDSIKHNSDAYIHLIAEMERRVYADRATHLGDPDFYTVPKNELMNRDYIIARMKNFNPMKATPSDSVFAGIFHKNEHEETTHFSIVDEEGNAVSVTTTLNGSYGSMVFVDDCGFLLNNEMDDFSVKPGSPNAYGLIGAEANAIAPKKRMLSSMSPTIIEKDGKLYMVIGTPGGSTIITSVFQTAVNVIIYNMGMQEAVSAPRFHHQWKPDGIFLEEEGFDETTISTLNTKGHKTKKRGPIGRVDAILIQPDGMIEGGADPRGDDCKMGY